MGEQELSGVAEKAGGLQGSGSALGDPSMSTYLGLPVPRPTGDSQRRLLLDGLWGQLDPERDHLIRDTFGEW